MTDVEVRKALEAFMRERGLPTLSQAVGVALAEWHAGRRDRVLHPVGFDEGKDASRGRNGVLPSPNARVGAFGLALRLDGLKAFARDHLLADHPLRDALLAEADVVAAEEFVAKLAVWCVLVSRKA